MIKYQYKCRQCGAVFAPHCRGGENESQAIQDLINAVNGSREIGDPGITALHSCEPAITGVADLIGCVIERKTAPGLVPDLPR